MITFRPKWAAPGGGRLSLGRETALGLATAAAAFLLDWGSLQLGRSPGEVASIWPGDAVILVMMLADGGRGAAWRMLAGGVGAVLAEMVWGDPLVVGLALTLSNFIGIAVMFAAFRLARTVDLQRARHIVGFLGLSALASGLSAALGGLALGWLSHADFMSVWTRWALGDFLGYAVVAPPVLVLLGRPPSAPRLDVRQAALTLLAYALVVSLVFLQVRYPLLFLIPLALFAVAYLVELEGVMIAVLLTVAIGTVSSMVGFGPGALVRGPSPERLVFLQAFLATITVSFLPISAAMSERRRLAIALREAREAAEADAALKSEFLANISHELRTPLASVLGFASILKQNGRLSEEDLRHAESISVAGNALLSTVYDILVFSEIEAGRLEVRAESASIHQIAEDAVRLVQPTAGAAGLKIEMAIDAGVPPALLLDRGRVRQVLLNLLVNAVKFTESGGASVAVGYDRQGRMLTVSVTDTGPGLEAGQVARLFDRFSLADTAQRRRHGGAGLGLAICKGLVDAMDGSIAADSVIGRGTTFRFRIPAPVAAAREAVQHDIAATLRPKSRSLLLVGRIAPDPLWARTVLSPLGLDIAEAGDLAAAVTLAQEHRFDLILLDSHSGYDVFEAARAMRSGSGASRMALLMAAGENDLEALRAAGFDGFVRKPVSPEDLIGLVMSPHRHGARVNA